MTRKLVLFGAIGALLLAGCATKAPTPAPAPAPVQVAPVDTTPAMTPRLAAAAEQLTAMAAAQDRLYQVAAPLLINNVELCKGDARNLLGFTAKNRYSYPGEYGEAAHRAFGMGERLQITGVLAGSGAARAGLQRGDGLLIAEGKVIPQGPNALSMLGGVIGPLLANHATLNMDIVRDGKERKLAVPVTRACGIGVELGNSDNINAYSDGNRILVTQGMMKFAQSNEEIAYVMAKTMAHDILGHAHSQRMQSTLSSMIDNLVRVQPDTSLLIGSAGIKAMPGELDAAADSLAVYLLARASYNIDHVSAFWSRLARTYPATVLNGYVANHPQTAVRIAAIDKAVADVKAKQAAKQPLLP